MALTEFKSTTDASVSSVPVTLDNPQISPSTVFLWSKIPVKTLHAQVYGLSIYYGDTALGGGEENIMLNTHFPQTKFM